MSSISPLHPSLGGAVGRTSGSILNLYILLSASVDVSHLGDLLFHQMLVGVCDLQLIDKRDGRHIVIAVIHQSLAQEIADILLEAFPKLHLDGEEVVAVLF